MDRHRPCRIPRLPRDPRLALARHPDGLRAGGNAWRRDGRDRHRVRAQRRLAVQTGRALTHRGDRLAASVLKGLASLRSPARLATAGVLSVLIWLCIDLGLIACFRALTPQLSFPTLTLACTIFIISQAISITPGSVGTYEGFFLLVLSTFGARPASLVAAAAVLNHVGNIVVLLLAGAIGALWLRVRRPALPVGLERPVPS